MFEALQAMLEVGLMTFSSYCWDFISVSPTDPDKRVRQLPKEQVCTPQKLTEWHYLQL
jgi:hypothetical protein